METLDDLMNQLEKNNGIIFDLQNKNNDILEKIKDMERDYLTISHACKKYDVSYRFLYNFIMNGKLKNYSSGTRILLKRTEVENVLLRESV